MSEPAAGSALTGSMEPVAAVSAHGGFIDRFQLTDLITRDAAGSVWRATDTRLGRSVGVRIVLPWDPRIDGIRTAACHAARVDDRRVSRVLDVLSVDGALVIITEWLDAVTLTEALAEPMTPARAGKVTLAVAEALSAIHHAGMTHGRVTPSTVLLTADGGVILRGHAIAAELWGPQVNASPVNADLFGIGAVFMACLTKTWPLGPADGLRATPVIGGRIAEPRQIRADIPQGSNRFIVRCLGSATRSRARPNVDPYADIDALLGALVGALHQHDSGRHRDDADPGRPRRAARRIVGASLASLGVAALGAIGAGLAALSNSPSDGTASAVEPEWRPPPSPIPLEPKVRELPNEQPVSIERLWTLGDEPPRATSRGARSAIAAIDSDAASAWHTPEYSTSDGIALDRNGLVLDLGSPQAVKQIDLGLVGASSDIMVRTTSDPALPADSAVLAELDGAGPLTTIRLPRPVTCRFVIISFRRIPASGGQYRGGVADVAVHAVRS